MTDYQGLIPNLILIFTSIVYEALPFVVLGVVLAGLLEEFVPQQAIAKVIPRNLFLAVSLGGILGLVFPMCECGIVVVMRRLLRKGLPLSVCVSYMLAGPILNVVVILSTYVAFNPPDKSMQIFGGPFYVALLRCGIGYLVAVNTAFIVEWQWRKHGTALLSQTVLKGLKQSEKDAGQGPRSAWQRLQNITQTALNDFIDIMAFLIIGAALAAGGRNVVQGANLEQYIQSTPAFAIGIMMMLAILFCICSEADAFIAANFPPIWPWASKMAFLTLGPMLDLKLYLMYTRVFRPRLIFTIILCVVSQVFVYNLVLHYAWPQSSTSVAAATP